MIAHSIYIPHRPLFGIALVIAGFQVLSLMDGVAKYLAAEYPVLQISWARFVFHVLCVLPVVLWRYGPGSLWPGHIGLQLSRGGLQLSATVLFFASLAYVPIVDAVAMVFVAPLFVTLLSPWVLGEHVGIRRLAAVVAGFAGILLVVRPGTGIFHWASLLALGAGISLACFLLLTRKMSGAAPALVTLTLTGLIGAIALSAAMPFVWRSPSLKAWGLMILLGVFAACGHLLVIKAYESSPASLLAPFGYSEIVTATAVSYLVFAELPDSWGWLGIGIVIASGVYIWVREHGVLARG
jgi:drug/metabolite transporter (DMT)-like permease